jgi:hypothetical protein
MGAAKTGAREQVEDVQDYRVVFVGDDELPDEQDWAFVEYCDRDETVFALKKSRLTEVVLEDAWRAYVEKVGA